IAFRSFTHDNKPFNHQAVPVKSGSKYLCDVAEDHARRAANEPKTIVFYPPIATFTNAKNAGKEDVADGLSISVEIPKDPDEALAKLEEILGPATCVVKSGGEGVDENGRPHDKLDGHWGLGEPARRRGEAG